VAVHDIDASHPDVCLAAAGMHGGGADDFELRAEIARALPEHHFAKRKKITLIFAEESRRGDAHLVRGTSAGGNDDGQQAGIREIFAGEIRDDRTLSLLVVAKQLDAEAQRESVARLDGTAGRGGAMSTTVSSRSACPRFSSTHSTALAKPNSRCASRGAG